MRINLVDTTLRDGEQKPGIALGINEKIEISKLLDSIGIYQIEAGTPAMEGDEKLSIERIAELGLKSKISSWNRMSIKDIKHSIDCKVDIIHISVPASDLQLKYNLNKSREWIISSMKKSIYYAISKGYEVTIGLEDASRANLDFLIELCKNAYFEGVKRIRYADTVGILYPRKAFFDIKRIMEEVPIEIEMHTHNDFGMAEVNSLSAVKAGARYIDTTIGGIGERAGNCNFINFSSLINKGDLEMKKLKIKEEEIKNIINYTILNKNTFK
ncbi:beta/alpha barrel domain-containing protein [Clostridium felsineum]|uniref:homocitrate synthase n=1 Tax=Clostridium felsineum TaxID=36839 RepID=UPI00098C4230|nr:homocitrate synthase [Clostridium felsineum]URZ02460.1 2-phosphonomethylmalate synthase [Clostridium felsineum]